MLVCGQSLAVTVGLFLGLLAGCVCVCVCVSTGTAASSGEAVSIHWPSEPFLCSQ